MTQPKWTLEPGTRVTRAEVQRIYGGGSQGGILPSASTPNILIYSDPTKGRQFGYDYDGWTRDGQLFLYTGEGQVGEQQLRGGNFAIANHTNAGKALRLFVAVGKVPNSGTLIHEYIGEFYLDPDRPWLRADALDREQQMRSVLVFRLHPVGNAIQRPEDSSVTGDAPPTALTQHIALEAQVIREYDVAGTAAATARRRENELTARFHAHLESQGHDLCRLRIQPPGELRPLYTDTYDETTNTLYEAKSSATRRAVRELIGQLLDYRRHVDQPDARICALLPSEPSADLLDLIHSIGAGCVWPSDGGDWLRSEPS